MLDITTVDKQTWDDITTRAETRSRTDQCTVHVNARVRMFTYGVLPRFEVSFELSDWYTDDATVATYYCGRLR